MENAGQIKFAEGWDRANLRLADVENSGRADIIWLNKYTGAGSVWKNDGYKGLNGGPGGSSFSWTKRGVLYSPIDRGEVMNFANLGGLGRADLVQLYPTTNQAYTNFNKCPTGGDDGAISDPKLPVINDSTPPRGDGDWPDGFPTADHWLALGDSYSAGVGAGDLLDNPQDSGRNCLTTSGSYPKRLESDVQALKQGLEFLSCTGDVISNVNDAGSHGRATQQKLMSEIPQGSYKVATLSIGGNDLGFSDIVKSCIILGPAVGDCEQSLKNAESIAGISPRDSAAHGDVYASLLKVYRDILDTAGDEFTLVVTGYAQFFANTHDNLDCNNGQIQLAAVQDVPGLDTRPSLPLTVELRDRINGGVKAFNIMIQSAVQEVQQMLEHDNVKKRIQFVDINPVFEGHRFCERGQSTESGWPEFTNRAWFFSSPFRSDIGLNGEELVPREDDNSPKLQLDRQDQSFCDDPYSEWDCALGKLVDRDPDMPLNPREFPKDRRLIDIVPQGTKAMFMKAFHPKTIAYDAIAKKIALEFGTDGTDLPQGPQDTMDYIVYPEHGRDAQQVEEIAASLQSYGSSKVTASNTQTFGLNYWRISSLTVEQAMEISNITNVASVNEDCGNSCTDDPTTAMVFQEDAPAQLRYISGAKYLHDPRYYFDESSGEGIRVYIVDTGVNLKHTEFDLIRDRAKWIQVGIGEQAGENDCKAHGTSMLSLVAGKTLGVAKNIDPIIVRMPCRGPGVAFSPSDWIDGLGAVNDQIDASTPSVVLMASYWPPKNFRGPVGDRAPRGFLLRHLELLASLASKGAILVTGTGNGGGDTVDGLPANFGKPIIGATYVPSLLVMGGVSADGTNLYGNRDIPNGLPHAYAPGSQITAADSNEDFWAIGHPTKGTQGTSCSAAFTAGLAAYFLGLAKQGDLKENGSPVATDPQSMKDFIVRKSWSRTDVQGIPRSGIWNDADLFAPSQQWSPNTAGAAALLRRNNSVPLPLG
ncbi:hypothetical protein LTR27_000967 [Elasticomyces elasticus]|nr:hypothetical protein LTR27_000967 [Elasticomyces elasticus]